MNVDQALGQIRPLTHLIGTLVLVVGVLKFFGVQIPISGSGIELAVIGYLTKSI